nr:hypothetical protein [Tanacetum cinerariifolium]
MSIPFNKEAFQDTESEFDLFSNPENQSEEEVAEAITEPTIEEYMIITRINYESGNEKGRGDDEEVITDNELSNPRYDDSIEENERTQIFRIDTDIFRFKTPIFKNGTATWPTCNWKEDIYCNTRDLPGFIREGNLIRYKDYECDDEWDHDSSIDDWKDYEHTTYIKTDTSSNQNTYNQVCQILMDHNDTRGKQGWFDKHELMKDEDDDISDFEDYLIQKDPLYYVNEEDERSKERRCKLLGIPYVKPPTCKMEKFEVVKYSFEEDTAYLCLHFTKDHKGMMINTPYLEKTNTPYSSYGLRKKYRLSLKNDMPHRDKRDNLNITMEEYIRLEEEKARRHAIVYNDGLTSKSDFSTEPVEILHRTDEFDLKDETSLFDYDEKEQNIFYFNDLFLFNIIYPDNLKPDKDNDDNEIDIIQSSGGDVEGYTEKIVHDLEDQLKTIYGR